MLDEVDIELRKEARRRGRVVLVILVVGFIGVGAFCWVNRDSMWRGVLSHTLSAADIAKGDGCGTFIGSNLPEMVDAVRQNFPDADSVRPIETVLFDSGSTEGIAQTRLFGAEPGTVPIDMKFAARNKAGAMQFFTAGAALYPQTCAVKLLTIIDDTGNVVLMNLPTPPAGT